MERQSSNAKAHSFPGLLGSVFRILLIGFGPGLALAIGPAGTAFGHGVYIFAWDDGDRICTDSYFSKNNKVQGGTVSMRNAAGDILQSGTTGRDGGFCFGRPAGREDLIFVIEAGEGHRAEFKLRAEDLTPAVPIPGEAAGPQAAGPPPASKDNAISGGLDEEELRRVVREELQNQLSPIRRALAEGQRDQTPGLREIAGGLGWLAGLSGLAFWWAGRKKR